MCSSDLVIAVNSNIAISAFRHLAGLVFVFAMRRVCLGLAALLLADLGLSALSAGVFAGGFFGDFLAGIDIV